MGKPPASNPAPRGQAGELSGKWTGAAVAFLLFIGAVTVISYGSRRMETQAATVAAPIPTAGFFSDDVKPVTDLWHGDNSPVFVNDADFCENPPVGEVGRCTGPDAH